MTSSHPDHASRQSGRHRATAAGATATAARAGAIALAAAAFLVWAAGLLAPAAAHAAQVTARVPLVVDGKYQYNPAVDGDLVVYQQKDAAGYNLYGYDLGSGEKFPVCTAAGDQRYPAVSGDTVVWLDTRSGNADVYGAVVDPATHAVTEFAVCVNSAAQAAPAIDAGWVVWPDKRNGDWDVYGATITGTTVAGEELLCIDPAANVNAAQTQPDVSGDVVVWTDGRYSDTDIRGYNRVAKYEFPICLDGADQLQPAVDGRYVVWSDWRGVLTGATSSTPGPAVRDEDIYGFDLTTSREFAVSTAPYAQREPAISDDLVVWSDAAQPGSTYGFDIWMRDLSLGQELPVATYVGWQGTPAIDGETVVWADKRAGADADLYAASVSPWIARLRVQNGAQWTRTAQVQLNLFGQSHEGIVTTMQAWNAGDTAEPAAPYATIVKPWTLPGGDGVKTVRAQFGDLAGTLSPVVADSITLDTHGPATRTAALTLAHGASGSISYRVDDDLSPKAEVTIRVKNPSGATVAISLLGWRKTGASQKLPFTATIAAGTYKIRVYAKDLAGNTQATLGTATLTVTP